MIYGIKLLDDGEGSKFDAWIWIGRDYYGWPIPAGMKPYVNDHYYFATENLNIAYDWLAFTHKRCPNCIYEVQEYK